MDPGCCRYVTTCASRRSCSRRHLIPRRVFRKPGRSSRTCSPARWMEEARAIARRGQEQLVVREGVQPGERVALKDPMPPAK